MAMLYRTNLLTIPFVRLLHLFNTKLPITGTIKCSSSEPLYQELGLESLSDRRWYRRLVYYFNIVSCKSPAYLCSLLPAKQQSYDPLRSNLFRNFTSHTNFYENSFFPYCTSDWNKLGPNLRNSNSVAILKKISLLLSGQRSVTFTTLLILLA